MSCNRLNDVVESFITFSCLLGYEIEKHINECQELIINVTNGDKKIRLSISIFDNQFHSIDLNINTYFSSSFIHKNHFKILQEAINCL